MVDRPNTTPIGQDRQTLTFKALLYLNVAVNAQVCRPFCVVYIYAIVRLGSGKSMVSILQVDLISCWYISTKLCTFEVAGSTRTQLVWLQAAARFKAFLP